MYELLSDYERALARFGDKVGLIAGLEISDKISPEEASWVGTSRLHMLKRSEKKKRRTIPNSSTSEQQRD